MITRNKVKDFFLLATIGASSVYAFGYGIWLAQEFPPADLISMKHYNEFVMKAVQVKDDALGFKVAAAFSDHRITRNEYEELMPLLASAEEALAIQGFSKATFFKVEK